MKDAPGGVYRRRGININGESPGVFSNCRLKPRSLKKFL
jgi:hypothetical protein